ncbi:hypothetical protein ACXJJ3_36660 [Kribbella sp. WER1]
MAYDDPAGTRAIVREAVGLGFDHIVLSLRSPYPDGVVEWLVREIIDPFD